MKLLVILTLPLTTIACVSNYNALAHQQLTGLQAYHMKMLDDYADFDYKEKGKNTVKNNSLTSEKSIIKEQEIPDVCDDKKQYDITAKNHIGNKKDPSIKFNEDKSNGDLKFREAYSFSKSLGDNSRTMNIKSLYYNFNIDMDNIQRNNYFINYGKYCTYKGETLDGYKKAIESETVRKKLMEK